MKIAFFVILGITFIGILVGFFSHFHLFGSLIAYVCLPASAIALLVAYTKHTAVGYQAPMPNYDHGDGLSRMNAILRFEVNGHVYGEDRGELTVVDNWLVFEGAQTSFSISPNDASEFLWRMPNIRKLRQVALGLKWVGAKIRVRIIADDPSGDPWSFASDWKNAHGADQGITVLHPLEPQPGFRRGPSLWIEDKPTLLFLLYFFCSVVNPILRHVLRMKEFPADLFLTACLYTSLWYVLRLFADRSRKKALLVLGSVFAQLSSDDPSSAYRARGFETSKPARSFVITEADAPVFPVENPTPSVTIQSHGN